jgi:hypothetical protein
MAQTRQSDVKISGTNSFLVNSYFSLQTVAFQLENILHA